ncbi:MAG TPA: lysophospholipid acyltransferase family protein [Polyangiaceae bacterium]|nr:lysophospholipid acyltransferase family protein [Polyangiaceae bacterium]
MSQRRPPSNSKNGSPEGGAGSRPAGTQGRPAKRRRKRPGESSNTSERDRTPAASGPKNDSKQEKPPVKRRRRRKHHNPQTTAPTPPPSAAQAAPPPQTRSPDTSPAEESIDLDVFDPDGLGIGSRMVPFGAEFQGMGDIEEIPDEPARRSRPASGDVEEQIRALEARLDGMIRRANLIDEAEETPPSIREQVGSAAREVVERLASPLPIERPGSDDGTVVDAARELFSSKYYLRQWGRIGMRNRSEEVDDFGLDPTYEERLLPLFDFLYKRYFRIETTGIENVPHAGRCVIVANHSGTIPLDGAMLRSALRLEHPTARELRWLAEDYIFYLPFVGAFMNRIGAVRACQENAERLLRQDAAVAVFPEGVQGIRKLFKDRYQLQRFGRGGFIRLCLRTQTPIVPCAVVGAEEASPMLYRVEYLSKALGLPYLPVTPTFPWLGPLGLVPAPSKWRIYFGDVIHFDGYGPGAADDHVLVGRLAERVRSSIQNMLDQGVRGRKSVWFG